jgi:hypothetical protein
LLDCASRGSTEDASSQLRQDRSPDWTLSGGHTLYLADHKSAPASGEVAITYAHPIDGARVLHMQTEASTLFVLEYYLPPICCDGRTHTISVINERGERARRHANGDVRKATKISGSASMNWMAARPALPRSRRCWTIT